MISGSFSRGTTPTHVFTLPFEKELLADLRINYFQDNKEVLVKGKKDVTISGNDITLMLTQEETFLFKEGHVTFLNCLIFGFVFFFFFFVIVV